LLAKALPRIEVAQEEMEGGLIGLSGQFVHQAESGVVKQSLPREKTGAKRRSSGGRQSRGERLFQVVQLMADGLGAVRVDQLEPSVLGRTPGREELEPVSDAGRQGWRIPRVLESGRHEIRAFEHEAVGPADSNAVR
jgi:hypothetical protein